MIRWNGIWKRMFRKIIFSTRDLVQGFLHTNWQFRETLVDRLRLIKRECIWIIWFQYLRICITFSFCFKIVRHVKICQLFIYDCFGCLKILFFQWFTSLRIVFGRMITLLHPTMTFFTWHSHFAPCSLDRLDFIRKVPKLAPYWFVIILFRISSIILNIMGIGTFISLMTNLN